MGGVTVHHPEHGFIVPDALLSIRGREVRSAAAVSRSDEVGREGRGSVVFGGTNSEERGESLLERKSCRFYDNLKERLQVGDVEVPLPELPCEHALAGSSVVRALCRHTLLAPADP